MSDPTQELDTSLWQMYVVECEAAGIKPDLSDYQVFLQEADLDRSEQDYDES